MLALLAQSPGATSNWPENQLKHCADAGFFRWFVPEQWGGTGYSNEQIVRGYLKLAAACLTTTFVITQRTGACKRIIASDNELLRDRILPKLASGEIFATLGISHLTTSHRHTGKPTMEATPVDGGWELNGFCPWVTGGAYADYIVVGAELANDQASESRSQILVALPTDLPGITCHPGHSLVALTGSNTGKVELKNVFVSDDLVMAGPVEQVLKSEKSTSTGGLQTSALAIGLASAAIDFLRDQSTTRPQLSANHEAMREELEVLQSNILDLANGNPVCSNEQLRISANSFVLRATQSALVAAKGAGFVASHDVGRWCREALFFLVWSCPQNVSNANLCEFAGIQEV